MSFIHSDSNVIGAAPRTPFLHIDDARTQLTIAVGSWFAQLLEMYSSQDKNLDLTNDRREKRPSRSPPLPWSAGAIKGTVGLAKTSITLANLAEFLVTRRKVGDNRKAIIAVPTHRLSNQQAEDFKRVDPLNGDATMCLDLDRIDDALKAGAGKIENACCKKKLPTKPNGHKQFELCPFYDKCGYQRQKQEIKDADVVVIAHGLLFHEKPEFFGNLACVVVDESAWQAGLMVDAGSLSFKEIDISPGYSELPKQYDNCLEFYRSHLIKALNQISLKPGGITRVTKCAFHTELLADDPGTAIRLEWTRKQDVDLR